MCALFGEARDISLFRHINRELINNIIEQKIGYYKIVLDKTTSNIYGEANGTKIYNDPVLINCLVDREDQVTTTDEFGSDVVRNLKFRFLRDDLAGNALSTELNNDGKGFNYNILPEVGDIILWNNDYYEVDGIVENQYFMGKYPEYSYSSDNDDFGTSLSIILTTHYMRPEKLCLKQERI
jgi:hypothetical protein